MTRTFRLTALQLAICAMLLRALIPAGWMPNIGSDASSSMFTICAVDSGAQQDGSGQDGQKQAGRHEVCPFAAAPQLATPAVPASLAVPSLTVAVAEQTTDAGVHSLRAEYASQAPRAPPVLATI